MSTAEQVDRVDSLARAVATLVREVLREAAGAVESTPLSDYYDQNENPFRSKRRFLEAARRGAFPSSAVGKLVLAERAAVDAYIKAGTRGRATGSAAEPADDLARRRRALEAAGLVPKAPR